MRIHGILAKVWHEHAPDALNALMANGRQRFLAFRIPEIEQHFDTHYRPLLAEEADRRFLSETSRLIWLRQAQYIRLHHDASRAAGDPHWHETAIDMQQLQRIEHGALEERNHSWSRERDARVEALCRPVRQRVIHGAWDHERERLVQHLGARLRREYQQRFEQHVALIDHSHQNRRGILSAPQGAVHMLAIQPPRVEEHTANMAARAAVQYLISFHITAHARTQA